MRSKNNWSGDLQTIIDLYYTEVDVTLDKYRDELLNKIIASKSIAIFTHPNPDADAIASSYLVFELIKRYNKKGEVYLFEPLPHGLTWLATDYRHHFIEYSQSPVLGEDILVLFVDIGTPSRIGPLWKEVIRRNLGYILIDHHLNSQYSQSAILANSVIVSSPTFVSTTELLWRLFRTKLKISPKLATLILAGILADTDGKLRQNIPARVDLAVGYLKELGADENAVIRELFRSYDATFLQMEWRILQRFVIVNRVAVLIINNEEYLSENNNGNVLDAGELAERLRVIAGIDHSCVMIEKTKGTWRVSLRSHDASFNVSEIANIFGGGGHRDAAAFTTDLSPDEVLYRIQEKA